MVGVQLTDPVFFFFAIFSAFISVIFLLQGHNKLRFQQILLHNWFFEGCF